MVAINPLTRVDTSLELINANFAEIKETLENKVLYRDGSKTLTGNLDFDSNQLLNADIEVTVTTPPVDLGPLTARIAQLEALVAALIAGGGGGTSPVYATSLKFNDKRNSAYAGAL